MANVYQMVTDRIVEQMKKGIIPWHKPWMTAVYMGGESAVNYVSRKPYSLLNQLLLGKPGEWLTWKQIEDCKGRVKKGTKSSFVVFYQMLEKEVEDEEGNPKKVKYPILKWYKVFHIDDTEGIKSKIDNTTVKPSPTIEPIEVAEEVIKGYLSREPGLKFISDKESGSAYYSPASDTVVVPRISQYEIPEEYYSTTFHELTHSTMHEKRCDRKGENKMAAFGNEDYSREELVAELGSAMICNTIGIEVEKAFRNSVAYIQGWLKELKNDPKMIVWASGRAEKAAKYILNRP